MGAVKDLGKNVVVHGATLKCSESDTMSFLKARDMKMEVDGRYIATVKDHKPDENIIPFGLCKHPNWKDKPCEPITPSRWKPGEASVKFSRERVLDDKSKCKCDVGGIIEIVDSGQAHPFYTVDCMSYSNAAMTFLRKRHQTLQQSREDMAEAFRHANEADDLQTKLWYQLGNTALHTGKTLFGDDPVEIGLNLINPVKKLSQLRHLGKLPGALKDTWKAIRGGKKGGSGGRGNIPAARPRSGNVTPFSIPPNVSKNVPKGWERRGAEKGRGIQWINPDNKQNRVRYMAGNPSSPHANQRRPYVVVRDKGGRTLRSDGSLTPAWRNPKTGKVHPPGNKYHPDGHQPVKDFKGNVGG
jgi:hypothetical protein